MKDTAGREGGLGWVLLSWIGGVLSTKLVTEARGALNIHGAAWCWGIVMKKLEKSWADKMSQWLKALAPKPDDLT